jgi:hypothetical protein
MQVGQHDRAWRPEQVPLSVRAAELDQHRPLLGALNPFGDHLATGVIGHRDDPDDDRPGRDVAHHRGDERAVDLDLVEPELAQVGQLTEPGAEIVERDPGADVAQPREHPPTGGAPAQQHSFGDLERDGATW